MPSYHLGNKMQQIAVNEGYDETREAELLAGIGWPADGYRLFEIASFAGSYQGGVFLANRESNALTVSLDKWHRLGRMNPHFNDFGGGTANLDLYKRALEFPDTTFYVLLGEGSFHQHHGGVTTGTSRTVREDLIPKILAQDAENRGPDRAPPSARPILYGRIHPPAWRFIRASLDVVSPP